jgi:hypothetical protein
MYNSTLPPLSNFSLVLVTIWPHTCDQGIGTHVALTSYRTGMSVAAEGHQCPPIMYTCWVGGQCILQGERNTQVQAKVLA